MDLHRAEGRPDWANVPPTRQNTWQRIAAGTYGIVTIGNFFSLLGLISVPVALVLVIRDAQYFDGIFLLAVGRLCDLLDGWLADKTATKSPLGEKIDATFDKVSTAAAVIVLTLAGIFSWWLLVLLALPHAVIAVVALLAFRKGLKLHPSRAGKFSMAAAWLCMLDFIVWFAMNNSPHTLWQFGAVLATGLALLIASLALGVSAFVGYLEDFRGARQPA